MKDKYFISSSSSYTPMSVDIVLNCRAFWNLSMAAADAGKKSSSFSEQISTSADFIENVKVRTVTTTAVQRMHKSMKPTILFIAF